MTTAAKIQWEAFDAALFDLDGVLTDTAVLHSAAWKTMFDEYLKNRAEAKGEPFVPFDADADYHRDVDGKPRYDGVRDFLASRGITLPWGSSEDAPGKETVCGLGNRKDRLVNELMERDGVTVFEGSVRFLDAARAAGLKTAIVSSSRNCLPVLRNAGIEDRFDCRVDGLVAEERKLPGKPAPDTFLDAARELGATPARSILIEDAIAGVASGAAGQFGLVLGIARRRNATDLLENGAHLVVKDLDALL